MDKSVFNFGNFKIYIQHIYKYFLFAFSKLKSFVLLIKGKSVKYQSIAIKLLVPLVIICFGYFACSASQRTITKNINNIFSIADEIRSYYSDKPDYWGLDTKFAITQKIIPSNFIKDDHLLLSSSTEVLIGNGENAETIMPRSLHFDIIIKNLTKAQCISYSEFVLDDKDLLSLNSISIINSSGEYLFEWGNGKNSLPVKKYATKDFCIDGKNTLIWSMN